MEGQHAVEVRTVEAPESRKAWRLPQQVFSVLVILALMAGAWYSLAPQPAPVTRVAEQKLGDLPIEPVVGSRAPAVAMTDIRGQQISLDGLRGQPVVLEFWAVWCPECRKTMPIMERLYKENQTGPGKFEVMAVSYPTNHADVVSFVEKAGYTFPVAIDTRQDFINTYYVPATPTTFFIDKDGVIRDWCLGEMDESQIRAKLSKITA
ncbi:MAG: TlpA disulfide reductase family protein [Chloroflexi bacterium]|nr:TlpA disulfide reductase family protein [Chloroflexota bacterium]